MVEQDIDVVYYLTLENQNYVHPPMKKHVGVGVEKDLYKVIENKKAL